MQSWSDMMRVINHLWSYVHAERCVGELRWEVAGGDHDGWLVCDGRVLNVVDYPALYAVTGTSFGATAPGTFKLPDPRGRVVGIAGAGTGLTPRDNGEVVGTETHTLTVPETPAHTHGGSTDTAGIHNHGGSTGAGGDAKESESCSGGLGTVVSGEGSHTHTIASDGAHTHTFVTQSTGGGLAHNNMQPTLFVGSLMIYSGATVHDM